MKLSEILNRYFVLPLNQSELVCFSTEDHPEHGEIIVITWKDSDTLDSFCQEFVDQEVDTDLGDALRFKGQFNVTPIGDGGPVAFVALDAVALSQPAAEARPKRRPYNASGSLSEYGVFPECDVQQPAMGMEGFDEWFDEYTKNNYTDEMLAEAAWKAALAQQSNDIASGNCTTNGADVWCNGHIVATAHGLTLAPYRAARIAACVNACAGIEDPVAFIQRAKEKCCGEEKRGPLAHSRNVIRQSLHWHGIPVHVTGTVTTSPGNWSLIDAALATQHREPNDVDRR